MIGYFWLIRNKFWPTFWLLVLLVIIMVCRIWDKYEVKYNLHIKLIKINAHENLVYFMPINQFDLFKDIEAKNEGKIIPEHHKLSTYYV